MRKDDLVLTVLQNNSKREVMVIHAINTPDWIEKYLYAEDIEGAALDKILAPELVAELYSDIAFEGGKEDLNDALQKRVSVKLHGRHEEELHSRIRVAADMPKGGQPCFRLVINKPDEIGSRSDAMLQRAKKSAIRDDLTGLCTRATLQECADICQFYVDKGRFGAAVAYVSDEDDLAAIQRVAADLQQTFRDSDVLCHVEKGVFCILMPETSIDLAKIPLTRLRGAVENDVQIALTPIERGGDIARHIEKVSRKMAAGEKLGDGVELL